MAPILTVLSSADAPVANASEIAAAQDSPTIVLKFIMMVSESPCLMPIFRKTRANADCALRLFFGAGSIAWRPDRGKAAREPRNVRAPRQLVDAAQRWLALMPGSAESRLARERRRFSPLRGDAAPHVKIAVVPCAFPPAQQTCQA